MTRRLRVHWREGKAVDALLQVGENALGILLAHGAGAPQRHPFMTGMRRRLAGLGLTVMTFDYPYAAEGRKAPDRPAVLLDCHRAALDRLRDYADRVVLAGKSMGGRLASELAATSPAGLAGLVVYGYPLVSPSSPEPRDTSHLARVAAPMLFLSGDRDRLAPLPVLRQVERAHRSLTLVVIEGADHSFRVPKSSGLDVDGVLDRLAADTGRWLEAQTAGGGT